MDKEYFGYIYKFTNLVTNKIYIGKRQSAKFDESYFGSGKLWKIDLDKYGKQNISREVLEWCTNKSQLLSAERYWIAHYNSQDKSVGYNIHKGGQGGNSLGDTEQWSQLHKGAKNGRYHKPVSQDTRNKISIANSGKVRSEEVKQKISNTLKGRKKPEGFGEKISKAQKGRIKSESELINLRIGQQRRDAQQRSNALKGRRAYNNGNIEIHINPELVSVPEGYVLGRLPNCHNCRTVLNKRWINNGIIEKYIGIDDDIPDGFSIGRIKGRLKRNK